MYKLFNFQLIKTNQGFSMKLLIILSIFLLSGISLASEKFGYVSLMENDQESVTITGPWILMPDPYSENTSLRRIRLSSLSNANDLCAYYGDFYFDYVKNSLTTTKDYKDYGAVINYEIKKDPFLQFESYINTITCQKNSVWRPQISLAGFPKTIKTLQSVESVYWSYDQKYIFSRSDEISTWELSSEKRIAQIDILCFSSLSPDRKYMLFSPREVSSTRRVTCSNTIEIRNLVTGKTVLKFNDLDTKEINRIQWSHDGKKVLILSNTNTIKIWNIFTKTLISESKIDIKSVRFDDLKQFSWSPNEKYLITAEYKYDESQWKTIIKIWAPHSGKLISTFKGADRERHKVPVKWNRKGTQLAYKIPKTLEYPYTELIKTWDLTKKKHITNIPVKYGTDVIGFDPFDKYIITKFGHYKFWDLSSGKSVLSLDDHKHTIKTNSWSPDGKYLATGSSDNTIKLWEIFNNENVLSGKLILTLSEHTGDVNSVDWSPQGNYLVSGADDKNIKIWPLKYE